MPDTLFDVSQQTVLVSGGSRGIGKAIARGFADRGATVIVTGRDPESIEATAAVLSRDGQAVAPMVCDVADVDAIRRCVSPE